MINLELRPTQMAFFIAELEKDITRNSQTQSLAVMKHGALPFQQSHMLRDKLLMNQGVYTKQVIDSLRSFCERRLLEITETSAPSRDARVKLRSKRVRYQTLLNKLNAPQLHRN